jgi:Ca2+-binding RTX toxin-like protein
VAGVGTDTVTTGSGADLIVGDNGQIDWTASGVYSEFQTTDPTLGAGDTIQAGDGDNIVAGGFGGDTITTGLGEDLILGDNGQFQYTEVGGVAVLTAAQTTDTTAATGGNDVIVGGGGTTDNIVLAGMGDDQVNQGAATSSGADLVLGDNGYVTWGTDALITSFGSSQLGLGGNDLIDVGDGGNIVVGGDGNDTITTGIGSDVVLGDNGAATYTPGTTQLLQVVSTDTTNTTGGSDTIIAGDGANVVVAGVGADTVTTGTGNDTVLGDSASVTWDATGLIEQLNSTQPGLGADDVIDVGDGTNVVVGGFGSDTITTGTGSDIVIGDNGMIDATSGAGMVIATTDVIDGTGGNDIISTGDGTNLVLAGVGSDFVLTGSGTDVVVGDNGNMTLDATGAVVFVTSTDPLLGGSDAISTGNGNDVSIGGAQGDIVTSSGGNDILFGDGGSVAYAAGGSDITILSVDPMFGGDDTLNGGTGTDILIGGQGSDLLYGTLSEDLLFGSNAAVTMSGWRVTSMQSDTYDLVTESMFDQFSSGKGKGTKVAPSLRGDLSIHLIEISDEISATTRGRSPLDASAFRNIFNLGGHGQEGNLRDSSPFDTLGKSDSITLVPASSSDPLTDGTGESDSDGQGAGDGATPQAAWHDGEHPMVAGVPAMLPAAVDARGSDAMVLALGIVGLGATQQPKGGLRRPGGRNSDAGIRSRFHRAGATGVPR